MGLISFFFFKAIGSITCSLMGIQMKLQTKSRRRKKSIFFQEGGEEKREENVKNIFFSRHLITSEFSQLNLMIILV